MKLAAVDQYGNCIFVDADKPRQSLAEAYGVASSSLEKIYVDTKNGETKHVGYSVNGLWFTLYKLTEWSRKAVL